MARFSWGTEEWCNADVQRMADVIEKQARAISDESEAKRPRRVLLYGAAIKLREAFLCLSVVPTEPMAEANKRLRRKRGKTTRGDIRKMTEFPRYDDIVNSPSQKRKRRK